MDTADFAEGIPLNKREYLSERIHSLSKRNTETSLDDLELVSRQRAKISRNLLPDITETEIFLLRLYGTYGMTINYGLREHPIRLWDKSDNDIHSAIKQFREKYNLTHIDLKKEFQLSEVRSLLVESELTARNQGLLSHSIRAQIDNLIKRNTRNFYRGENYFYRISRAKKQTYVPTSESTGVHKNEINPGDIISDNALWSSASRANTALNHYSKHGKATTNYLPIEEDEEEILFLIENNQQLKAIDISGYKFPMDKKSEGENAGEILIKSGSKFRVQAIQKTERFMDRRIIVLEPVNRASLSEDTLYKNAFDGSIQRRLWFHRALPYSQ